MSKHRKMLPAILDTRMVKTHDGRILTMGVLMDTGAVRRPEPIIRTQAGSPEATPEVPSESAPKKWRHKWEKPSPSGSLADYQKYILDGMDEVRKDAELARIAEENKMRVLGAMNQTQLSWEQVVAVYRPARKNAMRKQRGMDRKSEPRERKSQSVYTTTSLEAMAEREHNSQD